MLERPPVRPQPRARRSGSDLLATLPVAAVAAAVWAAGVGLLLVAALVTLSWAVTGRGDDGIAAPVEASGIVWLAGHHAPVDTVVGAGPGASVTLLPLLVLGVVLALLVAAGRWAVRISPVPSYGGLALLVALGSVAYAAIGVLVAAFASLAGATVSGPAAAVATGLLAAVGLGAGAVAGSDTGRGLVADLPVLVRRAAVAGLASGAALVAFSAIAALGALAAHWSLVRGMTHQVAPGAGDAVGITLTTLAYLPNLLVWALAYVCGPGFGVGGGATVDPFSASGGLLPAVPVLGAIPSPAPALGPLLLLLPVLAGVVGAVVLRRRHRDLELLDEALALLAGALAVGIVVELLAALSGGSLGDGRLVDLGPPPFVTGLAAGGLVAAGSLLYALGTRLMPTVWVSTTADDEPAAS
jgi:hypothetical protein